MIYLMAFCTKLVLNIVTHKLAQNEKMEYCTFKSSCHIWKTIHHYPLGYFFSNPCFKYLHAVGRSSYQNLQLPSFAHVYKRVCAANLLHPHGQSACACAPILVRIEMVVHYFTFCCLRSTSWREWMTRTFQAHSSAPNFSLNVVSRDVFKHFIISSHTRKRHHGFNPDRPHEDPYVDGVSINSGACTTINGQHESDANMISGLSDSSCSKPESDHLKM